MKGYILALVLLLFNVINALSYPDPIVKLLRKRRSQISENWGDDSPSILLQPTYDSEHNIADYLLHLSKQSRLLESPLPVAGDNYYHEDNRLLQYKPPPFLPSYKLSGQNYNILPYRDFYSSFSHSEQSSSLQSSFLYDDKYNRLLNRFNPFQPSDGLYGKNKLPFLSSDLLNEYLCILLYGKNKVPFLSSDHLNDYNLLPYRHYDAYFTYSKQSPAFLPFFVNVDKYNRFPDQFNSFQPSDGLYGKNKVPFLSSDLLNDYNLLPYRHYDPYFIYSKQYPAFLPFFVNVDKYNRFPNRFNSFQPSDGLYGKNKVPFLSSDLLNDYNLLPYRHYDPYLIYSRQSPAFLPFFVNVDKYNRFPNRFNPFQPSDGLYGKSKVPFLSSDLLNDYNLLPYRHYDPYLIYSRQSPAFLPFFVNVDKYNRFPNRFNPFQPSDGLYGKSKVPFLSSDLLNDYNLLPYRHYDPYFIYSKQSPAFLPFFVNVDKYNRFPNRFNPFQPSDGLYGKNKVPFLSSDLLNDYNLLPYRHYDPYLIYSRKSPAFLPFFVNVDKYNRFPNRFKPFQPSDGLYGKNKVPFLSSDLLNDYNLLPYRHYDPYLIYSRKSPAFLPFFVNVDKYNRFPNRFKPFQPSDGLYGKNKVPFLSSDLLNDYNLLPYRHYDPYLIYSRQSPAFLPFFVNVDKYNRFPNRFKPFQPSDGLYGKNKVLFLSSDLLYDYNLFPYPCFFDSKQPLLLPPYFLDDYKYDVSPKQLHPLLPSYKWPGENKTPFLSSDIIGSDDLPQFRDGFLLPAPYDNEYSILSKQSSRWYRSEYSGSQFRSPFLKDQL
uniref:Uncharacterized protein LOC114329116 isoform X1 n=1 Tax=Diabrotica virgifera virgifera TaxID=50390 RepID=A0A6P7FLG4_DIAVI